MISGNHPASHIFIYLTGLSRALPRPFYKSSHLSCYFKLVRELLDVFSRSSCSFLFCCNLYCSTLLLYFQLLLASLYIVTLRVFWNDCTFVSLLNGSCTKILLFIPHKKRTHKAIMQHLVFLEMAMVEYSWWYEKVEEYVN